MAELYPGRESVATAFLFEDLVDGFGSEAPGRVRVVTGYYRIVNRGA